MMKLYAPPELEYVAVLQDDILTESRDLADLYLPEGDEIDRVTWN